MEPTPAEPIPAPTSEVTGRDVAALVMSLLGLVQWCPCIGSIAGIVLGTGSKSSVAKAAVILGWIGLAIALLFLLVLGGQLALIAVADHL
jgi:hypothetical protein